jgi:hypothetical protein
MVSVVMVSSASARPSAPTSLCRTYPTLASCTGAVVNCSLCHSSTDPPSWNSFGVDVAANLDRSRDFENALPDALHSLETADSDGDGVSNLLELELGTRPGLADSAEVQVGEPEGENSYYQVGAYDPLFAFRRVSVLYCGRSPTFAEVKAFKAAPSDTATRRGRLHEALSRCLASDYWTRTALPRLADKRIRPLYAAGADSDIKISGLRLVIGDYQYDYRLWRYALTGDRDMRELLTADYYVVESSDGKLEQQREVIVKPDPGALAGGQPLPADKRAGMLTTQWFLAINTMFSALPRTTAAQAYRSYLNADLSSNDGIRPVAGEPADIDKKGVAEPRCASCHSTLDPLAYAFAKYEGINMGGGLKFGFYLPERIAETMPEWDDSKQRSVVLGEPVDDLVSWAKVAANSDEFKRNMAEVFFRHALNRPPGPAEQDAFVALFQTLPEDGYSANRLIHRLVDMASFGSP